MASNAAVPFWRAAGMTYITYSNICANLVRNCLKEPYKTEALTREKVHSPSPRDRCKPESPLCALIPLKNEFQVWSSKCLDRKDLNLVLFAI
ncbi:ATP synthase subunit epsilon, mitochondrial-like [Hibiscus syriacus]|uniref:ATP synthase subunit epsilon, mitochondrial-like n=1 Tax=Hibiscus syriacus TaxID=106335 RepID=UPI0019249DEA|nr:ATP synthase subunit epsilon, mitochondrial-like [Hibiscus syriacus]